MSRWPIAASICVAAALPPAPVVATPFQDQVKLVPATADDFPADVAGMLREALGDRLRLSGILFPDAFTEDAVLEFPTAPNTTARRMAGQAAAHAFYRRLHRVVAIESATLDSSSTVNGRAEVVLEDQALSRDLHSGVVTQQRLIATIELRDGRIAEYREYFGPQSDSSKSS